jgi:hypothetical protein
MDPPREPTEHTRPRGTTRDAGITEDQLHELRNHVHGIVMAVQLALDVEPERATRQRRNLHMIEERCRQLAAFTRMLRPVGALSKSRRQP